MAKKAYYVSWEAAFPIWWQMAWRFSAGTLLQIVLDWAMESSLLIYPIDGFLDIWIWLWAIRSSLMDRYPGFSLGVESKKTGQSKFNSRRQVGLYVAFRVWWTITWHISLVPTAITFGAALAAIAEHKDIFDFIHSLYSPTAEYLTYAAMLAMSPWAVRECLMAGYRSFRLVISPRSI